MSKTIHMQILRTVFPRPVVHRFFLGLTAVVLLLVAVFSGPWSPLALERARTQVVEGDIASALAVYERVATYNPLPSLRQEARFQAGVLRTTIIGDHKAASRELGWVAHNAPEGSDRQQRAMELLASTLRQNLDHPRRAAQVYERMARTWPDHVRADAWQMAAALSRELAGQPTNARLLRAKVAVSGGPLAAAAWLELGRTSLVGGEPSKAYDEYERAKTATDDPDVRRLARIGIALALEDLGNVEAAVAELDEEDLATDQALHIARERLLKRAESSRTH